LAYSSHYLYCTFSKGELAHLRTSSIRGFLIQLFNNITLSNICDIMG
jgi:hypothetical protein